MHTKLKHTRRKQNYSYSFVLLALWLILSFANELIASELYFIDAHSQVDHTIDDLDLIIQRMDTSGVYRTILTSRSGKSLGEVADFAEKNSERILPAIRTKSDAYVKNRPRYYKKMRRQLDSGRFKAMAEILLYHAQKGDKAPEVIVYPDDKRVQFALSEVIEKGWPFVIHIEFASLLEEQRRRFMDAMEKMLTTHPKHPFVLNHMGQLKPTEVGQLIEKHKNIYFLTAHTTPAIIRFSNQPWVNMFDGEVLAAKWKELILEHPDRFVFALDNVWDRHWKEFYLDQMTYWAKGNGSFTIRYCSRGGSR